MVGYITPAPAPVVDVPPIVVEEVQAAHVDELYVSAPAVSYAALAPVVEDIDPTPAVTYVAEQASVVDCIAPAPAVSCANGEGERGRSKQEEKRREERESVRKGEKGKEEEREAEEGGGEQVKKDVTDWVEVRRRTRREEMQDGPDLREGERVEGDPD